MLIRSGVDSSLDGTSALSNLLNLVTPMVGESAESDEYWNDAKIEVCYYRLTSFVDSSNVMTIRL